MREDLKDLIESAKEDLKLAREVKRLDIIDMLAFYLNRLLKSFLRLICYLKLINIPLYMISQNLINLCKNVDKTFEFLLKIKADKLDKYYTGSRYPPLLKVSEEEAEEAIKIAEKVKDFVLKKLKFEEVE